MPKSQTTQSELDRDVSRVAPAHSEFGAEQSAPMPHRHPGNILKHDRARLAKTAKQAQKRSDSFRAVLIATALPLSAVAVYFALAGPDPIRSSDEVKRSSEKNPKIPAVKATLPVLPAPAKSSLSSIGASAGTIKVEVPTTATRAPAESQKHPPLILNEYGELVRPYAIALGADGEILTTQTREETQTSLPAIDHGVAAGLSDLSNLTAPKGFVPAKPDSFVSLMQEGVRKLQTASVRDPDFRRQVDSLRKFVLTRMEAGVATAPNFQSSDGSFNAIESSIEVAWLRAAALDYKISGNRAVLKRIASILSAWAVTYQPSGHTAETSFIKDVVFAFDLLRSDLASETIVSVDRFLLQLASAQFERLGTDKILGYRLPRLIATLTAIGLSSGHAPLQWYASERLNTWVARSPIFARKQPTEDDLRSAAAVLEAMIALDQSTSLQYFPQIIQRVGPFVDNVLIAVQSPDYVSQNREAVADLLEPAIYFRPDVLPIYARLQSERTDRTEADRLKVYGSLNGFLNDLRRRPRSLSFKAAGLPYRIPATTPKALPQKAPKN